MAIALILDDDLGFVFWLAQTLAGSGFQSVPAQSVAEASRLLTKLRLRVDVLIFSPSVAGAMDYIRKLREKNDRMGVVAAVEPEGDLMIMRREVNAVRAKPAVLDKAAMTEWRRTIKRVHTRPAKGNTRPAGASDSA